MMCTEYNHNENIPPQKKWMNLLPGNAFETSRDPTPQRSHLLNL